MELSINDLSVHERAAVFAFITDSADIIASRCVCGTWRQELPTPLYNNIPFYEADAEPLAVACALNSKKLIARAISRGSTDYELGLVSASANGSIAAAEIMMDRGAQNYNRAIKAACKCDHPGIIQFIMERENLNANEFIEYAYKYARRNIADYFIARGTTNFDYALVGACSGGHLDLAKDAISRGARDHGDVLLASCKHGHLNIVEHMVNLDNDNLDEGVEIACMYARENIIEFLLPRLGDENNKNKVLSEGLRDLVDRDARNIPQDDRARFIAYLINKGADPHDSFRAVCAAGNLELVKILAPFAPKYWGICMQDAYANSHYSVIHFITSLIPNPQ